jgi:DNA-binding CsgD family transcriptional regulator/tetratricopeptide (TPR) repeat protein
VYGGTPNSFRSPLVGRSPQLQRLKDLYGRTVAGESATVLLWGEAGVGKTRLLDEFSSLARIAGARIAQTACFESLCPPFAPLREVFAMLGVGAFEAQGAESSQLTSETARYRAFSRAVESLKGVATTPLVLMLDDLQWADFATLEFLAFLMPRLAGSPLMILGAVRTEHLERDHVRREALDRLSHQGAVGLAVPPLDGDEMRQLVSTIWPEAGSGREHDFERICSLAEGKPYFAEELVRSVPITPEAPGLNPTPLSIRAGVLTRFDQLDDQQRRILSYASVIGRSFDAALLARVTTASSDEVANALSRACDVQLVREVRDCPGDFTFRHAITREILYRELLSLQTQTIHREVAKSLAGDSDADPLDLAYHWSAAGHREGASEAYERAGDEATARNAHRDAQSSYRGAIDLASGDDRYPSLCDKLSRALSINGEVDEACAYAERAVNAYEAAGHTSQAASRAIKLARRIYESGKPAAATAAAQRALRLSGEQGPVAYDAYVTLAHFEALQSRNEASAAYLAAAEATPGEHPPTERRNAYMVHALIAATSGRLLEAFDDYERAVCVARGFDDPEQLAWTLNNYASRAMATGWMDRAQAAHLEAARCVRSEEFGKVGASTIQGLAFASLLAGDLAAAHDRQHQDAQLPPGIAMTQTSRTALGLRLAYYRGDDDEAVQLATPHALELAFASGETQRIGLLAGCVAAFYDAVGRRDEGAALRSRALGTLHTVDFSFWLLDGLAETDSAKERDQARNLLARAATDPGHVAAQAHLTLFDARVARRRRDAFAKTLALDAAARFERIGWPWEQAQALEVAGRYAEALTLYRQHGFLRHTRDLEARRRRGRHRAGTHRLTPREAEIAQLAAQGMSNRAIATQLFIGERTVETHIAAIFDRFDLTSRTQLRALVDDPPGQVVTKPSS